MLSESAFRGYVLEELLAKALSRSGCRLIVEPEQDDVALYAASNGLRIRGRGADHQVDVLGQLDRPIPFSFPIRLFVEAKFHGEKVGLGEVRSAMGVISDVNQHYSASLVGGSGPPPQRYTYHCAMFSASGFTVDAQRYGLIHQLSLHDLRGESFGSFLDSARDLAAQIYSLVERSALSSFPLSQVRGALRTALGTAGDGEGVPQAEEDETFTRARDRAVRGASTALGEGLDPERLAEIVSVVAEFDDALYLGFTDSPFVVLVKPDAPDAFTGLARREERAVRLAFASEDAEAVDTGEWSLVEDDGDVLRLASPAAFDGILLGEEGGSRRRVRKTVSVGVGEATVDLVFEPLSIDRGVDVSPLDYGALMRRRHVDPALAYRRRREPMRPGWSGLAVRRLLRLLNGEGRPHAAILVEAARLGGSIDRDVVYTLAGYEPTRTLKGFTRPVRRLQKRLVTEGVLPPDAPDALITVYDRGVAKRFEVPDKFREVLWPDG